MVFESTIAKANLIGLRGDQPAPDGVALGPDGFAFVVKAPAELVHHDAEGDRVEARDDAAIEFRRARVDRDGMKTFRIAHRLGALLRAAPRASCRRCKACRER